MKKNLIVKSKRRLLFLLFLIFVTQIPQKALAQEEKITFSLKNASLKEIMNEIKRVSGYDFVYSDADLNAFKNRDILFNKASIDDVLADCLREIGLTWSMNNKTIVIKKRAAANTKQGVRTVSGKVTDAGDAPLPGVTVLLKGTPTGVATDVDGGYKLDVPATGDHVLVFSFIGMKPQERRVGNSPVINIKMEEEVEALNEVVVTGYFERTKNSFTGSVTSVKREELRKFGNASLISALQMVDPSFKIRENNDRGSDPNALPDFFVRGESSFMGNSNIPTFIVDGNEVSLQYVFDLDLDRIESLNILKDASATIHYGSRAASGVVVIETRRPTSGKFAVSYSNRTGMSIADLSDYDLMNANEKLEYEIKAGLFTSSDPEIQHTMDMLLEYYKSNLIKGINTDWLAQPVRNAVSQSHSLYIEGGSDAVVYGVGANYSKNDGVIKRSFRENFGVSFDFTYRLKQKINIRNSFSYGQVNIKNSPYGSFSDYAKANPYNPIYDEHGKMIRIYPVHHGSSITFPQYSNPLYNASLPYRDEQEILTINDNLSVDYFITPDLRFKGSAYLSKMVGNGDKYLSPNHTSFIELEDDARKGSYTVSDSKGLSYNINSTLAYSFRLDKHLLYSGVGINLVQNYISSHSLTGIGFLDERFDEIGFAMAYPEGLSPVGSEGTDRMVGFLGNVNYSYGNRYFVDLSARIDGSSKYGRSKRFAPLWSAGAGWNLHNEKFLHDNGWLSRLTLRASVGMTGNQQFEPYMAKTMLQYNTASIYYHAVGATFIGYGNTNLEWQQSLKRNAGLDIELLNRRLTARFDYYNERTEGLLLPVTVAPSLGFPSYIENYGEQSNKGYEFDINVVLIRNRGFDWAVNVSGTHNENRIEKISNALANLNRKNNENPENQTKPISFYEKGESLTAIKVVRSLGINPASGKELYLTRTGAITEVWDYQDKVVCGDATPELVGNIGTNVVWKQFSLNVLFRYGFGGQLYNSTLSERVEGADPYANADKRVLNERWQRPGDYSFYKDIADRSVSKASSRFVQDNNYIEMSNVSLSYRVHPDALKKCGLSALRIGLNSGNLFYLSTVKRERGLDYPFARQFTFSLNLNF